MILAPHQPEKLRRDRLVCQVHHKSEDQRGKDLLESLDL